MSEVIPAEAVEAAAKAFIEHGTLLPALEAAAPHIISGYFREINSKAIAHELENPLNFSKDAP